MQHYTDKQNNFPVAGSTALQAVRSAAERFPSLATHVFDQQGQLRRHINVFVNDTNIRDLQGPDTAVYVDDIIRVFPAISGGCGIDMHAPGAAPATPQSLQSPAGRLS
jgi:adenylyltransferase/sulfurtransferase